MDKKKISMLYVDISGSDDISIGTGGSLKSLLLIVKYLDKNFVDTTCLFSLHHLMINDFKKHSKVIVSPFRLLWLYNHTWRGFVLIDFCFRFLFMTYLMITKRIDIIHTNNCIRHNKPEIIVGKLFGKKIVAHERGLSKGILTFSKLDFWVSQFVDYSITNAKHVEKICKKKGIRSKNIMTIYNAVEIPEAIKPVKREPPLEVWRIGVVGRITEWKGQHLLIEATKILENKVDLPVKIYFTGGIDSQNYYQELLDQSKQIKSEVIFPGFINSLSEIYTELDICVLTSIDPEPFGRSIIEAMAFEIPVVVPREGGPVEIIDQNKTGLFYRPGDFRDLADQLLFLVSNPSLYEEITRQAKDIIIEKYLPQEITEKIWSIYIEIYNRNL